MIQFLGVSKTYPKQPSPIVALDNVSFEITEGEFVFLVGPSGSGKTTILKLLIREELPSTGKIYFSDQEVNRLKRGGIYRLRRQIGIIFQDYKLIEDKNAYENIAFAMEAAGQTKKEIKETVPYVLDIVNLADRADAFPSELSGGEKQRVAIARAISNNPKVLVADEPTGNLDPNSAWDVVQVLAKINKWGTTVIMSTHGTEIVNSLQKRVLKMEGGKLVRDDKKGRYEDVDEYSLKVLTNQEKQAQTIVEPEPAKLFSETPAAAASSASKVTLVTPRIITTSTDIADEDGYSISEDQLGLEHLTEKPKTPKAQTEKLKKVISIVEKADANDLGVLKLGKKLEEKLTSNGYKDVEDILSAGVAKVNEQLDKQEIKQLAKAIKKFVTTE